MTDEILFKYISDQANDGEKRKVQEWAAISEERKKELSRMKNSWVLASLDNEIDPKIKEREIQLILDKIRAINKKTGLKNLRIKWLKYAAAIVLITGLSGISGYFIFNSKLSNSGFTEIIVLKGERSTVLLPDGSSVQLNGGSSLKFNPSYQPGKRKVILSGEAFFKVHHDKAHPFIVETNKNYKVEVLGTSFNVSAYDDDKIITTYLETGKVKISIEGHEPVFLNPEEVASFEKSSGKMNKELAGDHRFSDWTKGILNFQGETIEELAKKLERRFDIEIVFGDSEVKNHVYSGSIKDEELNTVLEALDYLSAFEYKRDGKVVTLYTKK